MAVSASTTRRAALIGAAASCTAFAVPAAQAAHIGESPWDKARRLARELSAVLDELAEPSGAKVVAIVEPASKGDYAIGFMDREFYYTAVGARGLNKQARVTPKGLAKLAELLNGGKQAA